MSRSRAALFQLALAALFLAAAAGDADGDRPDPTKSASALVRQLETKAKRAHVASFGASKVVSRNGSLWLAFAYTLSSGREPSRVRVYRWSQDAWKLDGTVTGELSPTQWISAVSLTGSQDPDFAIQGCGAGDTNCLSVVSDFGGRWQAVPFAYGYGQELEVNGVPSGHGVQTEVDACSCAGGPSTWTFERYSDGIFRPADQPGSRPVCSASVFSQLADKWEIKVLRFDRFACGAGWAIAVGSGAGFDGPAVGLFDRGVDSTAWELLTLDNGMALPAAPAIYDIPLSLLVRLASGLGSAVAPQLAAAKLIARLQREERFYWGPQNGMIWARGAYWLVAVLPAGPPPNFYSPYPVRAVIYRWNGKRWTVQGSVRRLPAHLNVQWYGGWFVPVPAPARGVSAITFALAGSDWRTRYVITSEGGSWQVVRR